MFMSERRYQLNCQLRVHERAMLDRLHCARARMGLPRVGVRALVLEGVLHRLRELEGECVRRGVDYESLMRESAESGMVRRDDPPPASLDGFTDDPGLSV